MYLRNGQVKIFSGIPFILLLMVPEFPQFIINNIYSFDVDIKNSLVKGLFIFSLLYEVFYALSENRNRNFEEFIIKKL